VVHREADDKRKAVIVEPFQMAALLPKPLVDEYKEKKGMSRQN
jgi:hypothetical protein